MDIETPSLVELTRYLSSGPSTTVGPSINVTPHPSDPPYRTCALNQYCEVGSITPQGPAHACMSYGLSAVNPDALKNAYIASPISGNRRLGANHPSPGVDCLRSFAHLTNDGSDGTSGKRAECTARYAKIFKYPLFTMF